MTNSSTSPTGSPTEGHEKRDVSSTRVMLYGILGLLALVIVIVFIVDYFTAVKEEIVEEMVLRPESVALRELQARETEQLTSYALLDEANGIYRIPIERAIRLIAGEVRRPQVQRTD